jgi:hypothetical protein
MTAREALLPRIERIANDPRRDRGATRAIYSYPAKFQARLPAELIRLFTRPGELVVDPYAGGGTTGLEAQLAGRPSFGVDLSPFAVLLARVKTTPVDADRAAAAASAAIASTRGREVLDAGDVVCLGDRIAGEVARLAAGTDDAPPPERDLLRVALVHAVRMSGRRDFDGESIVPLFRRRVEQIARGLEEIPRSAPRPRFRVGSCSSMPELEDGAARLVVTSPPYKDLDVEYGLVQIQRPHLGRSKRSRLIWALLGEAPMPKNELCGGRGDAYFARLIGNLAEIRRVLGAGAPAFFWTGFKTTSDRDRFVAALAEAGLPVTRLIPARLSRDRVASSRSDHHGRPTNMLAQDYLIVTGTE